jgi:hypothetical protein
MRWAPFIILGIVQLDLCGYPAGDALTDMQGPAILTM